MVHRIKIFLWLVMLFFISGCKKYLDIIPDNVATIDNAFATRVTTLRYLITCYSGLPRMGEPSANPAFFSGEEFWTWGIITFPERQELVPPFRIARGEQNANAPIMNVYEDGVMFQTIRRCNTFIERVNGVFELTDAEKAQWKAEAKVIKAYCMLYLMRMYGPIPNIRESLPISASPDEVRYKRNKFDDNVLYLTELIDEAVPGLLSVIDKPNEDLGRITRAVALSIKADALMLAASPQFNGNPYYANWANKDGELLFGPADNTKWMKAADACKAAIEAAQTGGARLYREFNNLGNLNPAELSEYTHRKKVTNELWSSELVWGEVTASTNNLQGLAMPYLDARMVIGGLMHLVLGVNMKVANEFYTSRGVPIDEDVSWQGRNLIATRENLPEENNIVRGTTANVNFDREPRFYGTVGFDRAVWYGNGNGNGQSGINPWIVLGLKGQAANKNGTGERSNITGYYAKKLINLNTTMSQPQTFSARRYPFPIYRLSDLYLLCAEALNEVNGPGAETYAYVDSVRSRAGLQGVVQSWANYSTRPDKPLTKAGLRQIIQRERLLELAFEGKRFWDLRRWLLAEGEMNKPITGWEVNGETIQSYYQPKILFLPRYTPRDYLWPIRTQYLTINPNLVQSPGW